MNEIINNIPNDLENYVLKPLFSFGSNNVIIGVKKDDIEKIKAPENWILQKKIEYEPVFKEDDSLLKAEIRIMYLWPNGNTKPTLTISDARLTTGKIINVDHNKNKWTGATISFIQK